MPIKKENRKLYPKFWKWLSFGIRFGRADSICECRGECGVKHYSPGFSDFPENRCDEVHDANAKWRKDKNVTVVLTVGHIDHDPSNNDPKNLRAWCQRCHLKHDAKHHAKNAAKTRDRKKGPKLPGFSK